MTHKNSVIIYVSSANVASFRDLQMHTIPFLEARSFAVLKGNPVMYKDDRWARNLRTEG
jgi:hypothetical protein